MKPSDDNTAAKLNRVAALWQRGARDQALKDISAIVAEAPDHPLAREMAGNYHLAAGMPTEALEHLMAGAELTADNLPAQRRFAGLFEKMGQHPAAVNCAQRVARLAPDDRDAQLRLGIALENAGRRLDAIEAYRRAVEIDPRFAHALYNLGRMLNRTHQHSEAISVLRQCVDAASKASPAYNLMGLSLVRQGRVDEALEAYRTAIKLDPKSLTPRGNLPFASCYIEQDGEKLLGLQRDWARHALASLKSTPFVHRPLPGRDAADRPLRIGYVTPDFRQHVCARFLRAPYSHHDRTRFHIVSYYTDPRIDQETPWFQARSDTWRHVPKLSPDALAKQIHDDRIDILVDLTGMAGGRHLPAFALKPAPVQVTWLGYPATTGLEAIDARITDGLADPPGTTEAFHTESLVRLDPCFLCYSPWPGSEDYPTEPDTDRRPVTFGSFNNFPKLGPETLDLWARVLQRVPDSRLLLKARSLGDDEPRQLVYARFARHGIDPDRVECIGNLPGILDHLRLYRRLDIALDPFPYNGTTTTCEALWMGVPVVTLAGKLHAGRVGVSLLTNVGLPDLIAGSPDRYVEIAASLAADRDHLSKLRRELRPMMRNSPLMNAAAFTQQLEHAYRSLWADYLARVRGQA